jgi:quercetin dioxygenase-like cupin family protein
MIEKVFELVKADGKSIKQIIKDENIHYNQMILPEGEGLPLHTTNSNVYMTVLRGRLTISLDGGEDRAYDKGTILRIPGGTKMNARNLDKDTLEITVVKAPAPKM